ARLRPAREVEGGRGSRARPDVRHPAVAAGGPRVMTGHASGLITSNAEEADDALREQIKYALREPYRTLVGHLRHEVGHYYWDRLVWNTPWRGPFRQLFGDERASCDDGLKRNYEQGPPADWASSYVSSYATSHPWEDWAETWRRYVHVVDSLATAMGFGLDAANLHATSSHSRAMRSMRPT